MLRRLPVALSCALAALSSACSGEGTDPLPRPAPSVEALYGVAAETMLSPYPSDRYTVDDASTATGLRLDLGTHNTADLVAAAYGTTLDQLNAMDGFSTVGGAVATFSGPIDTVGLARDELAEEPSTEPLADASFYTTAESPIVLLDVDAESPDRGKLVGLVPKYWAQPANVDLPLSDYTLVAQPAVPLRPRTRYLFVLTDALRAQGGGRVVRSAETQRMIASPAGVYEEVVGDALVELEASAGIAKDRVVLATVFTTATIHDELLAMAGAARAAPAPALAEPFTVEKEEGDRVRFRAVYEAPEFRKPKPDGKWIIEDGAPVVQQTVGLEVFLAFADGTKSGPRPVVIFGHGLGGDKDGNWGTAERLAALNAAVFSIDSPEHGSRSDDPDNPLTATFGFFGIDGETQTFDIGRARDNFRQMASDQLELVRLIGSLGDLDLLPSGAPDGVPDLDVTRVLYIGHSFGSVQGPTIFALAPEITQTVWNVGGDGLMALLRDSGTFGVLVNALKPAGTSDGMVVRFFAMTQAIVDPGDPLNYARFGTLEGLPGIAGWTPRDALLQEVIDDSIVPNSTSEALARAAGLVLLDPIVAVSGMPTSAAPVTGNLASGATGAMVQFDRMHGGDVASHGELIFAPEAQQQYVEFFASGLARAHATVVPAY